MWTGGISVCWAPIPGYHLKLHAYRLTGGLRKSLEAGESARISESLGVCVCHLKLWVRAGPTDRLTRGVRIEPESGAFRFRVYLLKLALSDTCLSAEAGSLAVRFARAQQHTCAHFKARTDTNVHPSIQAAISVRFTGGTGRRDVRFRKMAVLNKPRNISRSTIRSLWGGN